MGAFSFVRDKLMRVNVEVRARFGCTEWELTSGGAVMAVHQVEKLGRPFFPSLHCCFWNSRPPFMELCLVSSLSLSFVGQPVATPLFLLHLRELTSSEDLSICIFVWQFLWDQFSDILAAANAPDNSDHRVRGTLKPFISNKMATPSWEANQKRNRKHTRPRRNKGLDISWKSAGTDG